VKNGKLTLIALFAAAALLAPAVAGTRVASGTALASREHRYRVVPMAQGLDHPWGMAFLPGGSVLITERPGGLVLVRGGEKTRVGGVLPEVAAVGQGGLLDIALHPDYERTGWIYLTFSRADPPGSSQYATALGRGRLEGAVLSDWEELFVASNRASGGLHFGSRIAFGREGLLYMTVGERGERNRAQDLGDHGGSVLRLTETGEPAPGNPFIGRSGALPEVFSYGHRNAQGLAVHPETGAVWLHEHGPRGGDEVNIIQAGSNYGWPVITYGREYSGGPVGAGIARREGMEQPLVHWTPSIAPSGMSFYTGQRFHRWRGDLFVGALAGRHLRRLVMERDRVIGQEVLLDGAVGRIRDVAQGPDGYLWIITDQDNGVLYRLEPAD
jgi:glucose/arabinose dehydrogenase